MAGYSGTPLVKKFGIKPSSVVALLGEPAGFRRELVGLHPDVTLKTRLTGKSDLVIWFVSSKRDLDGRIRTVARTMGPGLWISWPKKSSGMSSDLDEGVIRAAGLANGLVDYKVCAVNDTWSGLKFARRK